MTKIFWRELKTGELVEEGDFWTAISEEIYEGGTSLPVFELVGSERWGKPLITNLSPNWKIVRPTMLHKADIEPRVDEVERKLDPNL
jgi:hypothetical protein